MRVVADTGIVVSGLLWHGTPRQLLNEARNGRIALFTSAALLAELEDVLLRDKFSARLVRANVTVRELVLGYAALAAIVKPVSVEQVVAQDPDDDQVLACAATAEAEAIVSGDKHLLILDQYRDIPIVAAAELLALLAGSE
jgi:uncharacterized protein